MVFTKFSGCREKQVAPTTLPAGLLGAVRTLATGPCPDHALAQHRTGWAAKVDLPQVGPCCLKTYIYPGLEPLRGPFRTTFLCSSRPAREAAALTWFRDRELGAPEPLVWGEIRFLGWLTRAWILTRFIDTPDLEEWLRKKTDRAGEMATALGRWLGRAHALGLEDRNPHLRNFLAQPGPEGITIYKLDSPKAKQHSAPLAKKYRDRDLAKLAQDADRLQVNGQLRQAFRAGYLVS